MHVNLTTLKMNAHISDAKTGIAFIHFYIMTEQMEKMTRRDYKGEVVPTYTHPINVVISRKEAEFAIKCCENDAPFYPYFNDNIYLIRFTAREIEVIHRDGQECRSLHIEFPGKVMAGLLRKALSWLDEHPEESHDQRWEFEATPQWLYDVRAKHLPQVRWEYAEWGEGGTYVNGHYDGDTWIEGHMEYERVITAREKLDQDLADPRQKGLKECLDDYEQIARNNSDGEPCTVQIRFDENPFKDHPTSYTWTVTPHGHDRPIIWGGCIAHPVFDGEGEPVAWEYRSHT